MSLSQRLYYLRVLIGISFLIQISISYRLWLPFLERTFPVIPIWEQMPLALGKIGQSIQLGFLVLTIGFSFTEKYAKWALSFLLFLMAVYILQDINRLQAWVYQYFIMYSLLAYHAWKGDSKINLIQNALQIILIGTYFWSGFHKINIHFVKSVFPWLMGIFDFTSPLSHQIWAAYALAVFELIVGLGLLIPFTRQVFVYLTTLFHLGILVFLISDNWNEVVWAWNIAMILFVWLLFYRQYGAILHRQALVYPPFLWSFTLFCLLPSLNIWRYWDFNLSLTMYSGIATEGGLILKPADKTCLPPLPDDAYSLKYDSLDLEEIIMDDWSWKDLKVPVYQTEWVYKRVAKAVCNCAKYPDETILEIGRRERFNNKVKIWQYSCSEL